MPKQKETIKIRLECTIRVTVERRVAETPRGPGLASLRAPEPTLAPVIPLRRAA